MKILSMLLAAAALTLAAWWWLSGSVPTAVSAPVSSGQVAASSNQKSAAPSRALGPPAAQTSETKHAPAMSAAASARALLSLEFDKASDLKALYEKLLARDDPAARYFAAKALLECADSLRQRGRANMLSASRTRVLSPTDPKLPERTAAFDALQADRCAGFTPDELSPIAVAAALADAAKLGDPAARAAQIRLELQQRMQLAQRERRQPALTAEELSAIQQSVASADPDVLRQMADWSLLWARPDGLRVGPDQTAPQGQAWRAAWNMLACDSGADCGASTQQILMGCAMDGACGAPNLQAHLQQFSLSPYQYQEALRYQALIRSAVEQGRWDWLGLATPPTLGFGWRPAPPPK